MALQKVTSVEDYIKSFPAPIQEKLEQMRQILRQALPHATEVISYNMPAFKQHKVLVYFAGNKKHIGFYPTSSGIEAFKEELDKYTWSKGAIQFPWAEALPEELIVRIAKYRAEEDERNALAEKRKP